MFGYLSNDYIPLITTSVQPGRRLETQEPGNGCRPSQLVCYVHSWPFIPTSHWTRQTNANNYRYQTLYFCPPECSSQCLPRLYLEAETMYFRACLFTWICHIMCADDGGTADFLKDLFTIAPSIRVFVVVITLLASGPRIIITGPHLATTPHHLFLAFFSRDSTSTHQRRGVKSCLFKHHCQMSYLGTNQAIIVCCNFSVCHNLCQNEDHVCVLFNWRWCLNLGVVFHLPIHLLLHHKAVNEMRLDVRGRQRVNAKSQKVDTWVHV